MIKFLEILINKLFSVLLPTVGMEKDEPAGYCEADDFSMPMIIIPNNDLDRRFFNIEAIDELNSVLLQKLDYCYEPIELRRLVRIVGDNLVNNIIKQQLKLLSHLLTKQSKKYHKRANAILHNITLLFGLCSNKLSYIFTALFGITSARIFSF